MPLNHRRLQSHLQHNIYIHSSRGHTSLSNVIKPDLEAPGVVMGSHALTDLRRLPVPMTRRTGTSVAAHVRRAVANLMSWGLWRETIAP